MESATWLVEGKEPWRVMIVDDEDLVRSILADMVRLAGYQVCGEASDGYEAARMAGRAKPDIILMDIVMPSMDGVESLRLINASRPTCALMVSAYCSPNILDRVTSAGAQGFLMKPCRPCDLVPAIETSIAQFQQSRIASECERIVGLLERAWTHICSGGSVEQAIGHALEGTCAVLGHEAHVLAVRRGSRLKTLFARGLENVRPGVPLGPAGGRLGMPLSQGSTCQFRLVGELSEGIAALASPVAVGPSIQGCLYVFAEQAHRFSFRETSLMDAAARAVSGLFLRLHADRPHVWQRWRRSAGFAAPRRTR